MKIKKIYIAGQEGMVGQAIYKILNKKYLIINCWRKTLDLTNQEAVQHWFKKNKPDIVINAAGRVGGILDNSLYKADYIYQNTFIGFNLLNSSLNFGVKKFINLGSACIYPKFTKQPIKEEYLLSSYLEKTNEGYALSKIATLKYAEYIKEIYKRDYITLQPANLYGEGDNFNLKSSHVIPALIRKFHEAKIKKKKYVEVWGTGLAKREFLHVDDLAKAVLFFLKKECLETSINIGGYNYLSIKKLAQLIKKIVKFEGRILFNKNYPDGVKERKLDSTIINKKYSWYPTISLERGLKSYYQYFKNLKL
jgi:GDP-L-fucose synthase